jgi:putative lipoic acid-binding regulatory protein
MKDKDLIQFPADYMFKIMGEACPEFEQDVLSVLHAQFPNMTEGSIKLTYSKGNKYLSISATVYAERFEQLELTYQALKANPRVLFYL